MNSDLFSFCSKRAGARFFLPIGGAEIRDALHCIVFYLSMLSEESFLASFVVSGTKCLLGFILLIQY